MVKTCKHCGRLFDDSHESSRGAKRKYCSPRCKKNFENSQRSPVKRDQPFAGGLACLSEVALANLRFVHGELLSIGRQVDMARRSIESLLGARGPAQSTLFGKEEVSHE